MGVKIDMCSETESKPSEKPSSIMEPYRKGLRFIKLLGLPIKIKLSKDGRLIFEDHLRLLKCGCASAIGSLLGSISIIVLLINGISLRDFIKIGASKYGFEKWNIYHYYLTVLPCIIGPGAQAIAFQGTGKALTEFTTAFNSHQNLITQNSQKIYHKVWRRVCLINMLTLPIGVIIFIWGAFYWLRDELSMIYSLILGIGLFVGQPYLSISPISSATMELSWYCLALLKESLDLYLQSLKTIIKKRASGPYCRSIKSVLDDGQSINTLVSMAHEAFGSLIPIIYAIYLLFACLGLFGATNLLNIDIVEGNLRPSFILPSIACIFILAISVNVLYSFAKAGQDLADLYRKIKENLQEVMIHEVNSITNKERVKLEVLLDNFSEECPFTPLGVLNVNFSNVVSMAGLSFTYVIVLLQFQIGDRYQKPDEYLNITR